MFIVDGASPWAAARVQRCRALGRSRGQPLAPSAKQQARLPCALALPRPAARVGGHVSVGGARGAGARGVAGSRAKPAPMKLGAKKITAADLDLESMLNQ